MSNELVKQEESNVVMPELNVDIIKKYICPAATDQETYTFLQLCKAQKLNPFLKEAYLIKYGTSPATIVTGKETFTKRADKLPQYDGFKAGIIVLSNDKVIYREGSFYTNAEQVLGGWAEVYCKGKSVPFRNEVSLEEYEGKKQDGTTTKMWAEKKATMIRKVALVQSLREAFPDAFGGLYSPEEINTVDVLPVYEMGKAPIVQPPSQVKMPQSKSANGQTAQQTTEGLINIITSITKVTQFECKNKSIKYTIHGESDNKYSTFDVKFATLAKSFVDTGIQVRITHKPDTYKTIVSMDTILEEQEEPNDPELSKLAEQAAQEAGL